MTASSVVGQRKFRNKTEIHRLLREQVSSGLSIGRFCASHQIPEGSFHNWRRKYQAADPGSDGFMHVQIAPSQHAGLFAEVGNIKIYQPVSAAYLKELCLWAVLLFWATTAVITCIEKKRICVKGLISCVVLLPVSLVAG